MLKPLPSNELISLLWVFNNKNGEVGLYEFRELFSTDVENAALSNKYITRCTGRYLLTEDGKKTIKFLRRVVHS